jgi:uncharacterized membrane protein YphA (DoxX/SURF4 family)
MKKQIVIEIICFLFILLFVYASLMKLMDVEKFQVQLEQSPLLMSFASWLSWLVPVIELFIAGFLIPMRFRVVALFASFFLMVMFSTYIGIILTYGGHIPCSCGGILEKMGWTEHLIFNIAFVLLAVVGIILSEKGVGEVKIARYRASKVL